MTSSGGFVRHFVEELDDLRRRLLDMSGLVEDMIDWSVESLLQSNRQTAHRVTQAEDQVNQMEIDIDALATRLIALQQPMATDLRFLTAAIKINNDLERMGDLAVNIAERAMSLMNKPTVKGQVDIARLSGMVQTMVKKALDSFVRKDAQMARQVLTSDDAVDSLRDGIYRDLIRYMQHDPPCIPEALDMIFVARNLERIGDHATNIAEDVLFLVEGVDVRHHAETKAH